MKGRADLLECIHEHGAQILQGATLKQGQQSVGPARANRTPTRRAKARAGESTDESSRDTVSVMLGRIGEPALSKGAGETPYENTTTTRLGCIFTGVVSGAHTSRGLGGSRHKVDGDWICLPAHNKSVSHHSAYARTISRRAGTPRCRAPASDERT